MLRGMSQGSMPEACEHIPTTSLSEKTGDRRLIFLDLVEKTRFIKNSFLSLKRPIFNKAKKLIYILVNYIVNGPFNSKRHIIVHFGSGRSKRPYAS
jgi:hypothetical protein